MNFVTVLAVVMLFVGCSSKGPSSRYIMNSIKTADLDDSKSISRNELKMYFQNRYSQIDAGDTGKLPAKKLCPAILADRICEGSDVNEDGFITIDELFNRLDREFDRVNKDGKGDISYKEFHETLLP